MIDYISDETFNDFIDLFKDPKIQEHLRLTLERYNSNRKIRTM